MKAHLGKGPGMPGLLDVVVDHVDQNSLIRIGGYEDHGDGVFVYRGARPEGRWHGHGFLVHPRCLFKGLLTPSTVRKQRWCRPDRSGIDVPQPAAR
ncbi:MAG: hypothetical protein AAF211_07170 [Myxococcota bacterium]